MRPLDDTRFRTRVEVCRPAGACAVKVLVVILLIVEELASWIVVPYEAAEPFPLDLVDITVDQPWWEIKSRCDARGDSDTFVDRSFDGHAAAKVEPDVELGMHGISSLSMDFCRSGIVWTIVISLKLYIIAHVKHNRS